MTKTRRHQSGYVFPKGNTWFLRYRDDVVLEDGSIEHVQKCHRLAQAVGPYRSKSAARKLAHEFVRTHNEATSLVESTMTLNRYGQTMYLPYVKEQKARSTYHGYRNVWRRYVRPDGSTVLRDFRTFDGEALLRAIARRED